MTILEAITQLQNIKPNQYDEALMVSWLSDVDGMLINEYIKWHRRPGCEKPKEPEEQEETPVEPLPPVDTLENMPWKDIVRVANEGLMDDYGWAYHDTKTITFDAPVLGSNSITMEYVGKNYDDLADGSGKAPMSFLMKDLFGETTSMDADNNTPEGWATSDAFIKTLPIIATKIKTAIGPGIITPVIKYTAPDVTGNTIKGVKTELWQLSGYEAGNAGSEEKPPDIPHGYPVFSDNISRIKKRNGAPEGWWLRTSFTDDKMNAMQFFGAVNNDGGITGMGQASASNGLAIGFCIGKPKPAPEPDPEPERIVPPYDPEVDMDRVLIAPEPYSNLYVKYLAAQVDYYNGEIPRYKNSMARFNEALDMYAAWYNRNHMPRQDNFIRW